MKRWADPVFLLQISVAMVLKVPKYNRIAQTVMNILVEKYWKYANRCLLQTRILPIGELCAPKEKAFDWTYFA